MTEKSIQETYAPNLKCFGCGPANTKGLHIRSFPQGDEVVAEFQAEAYQEAFPGMLSGGIIGTILGALIVYAFNIGLSLAGVNDQLRVLTIGVLIITAVSIDQWIRKVRA